MPHAVRPLAMIALTALLLDCGGPATRADPEPSSSSNKHPAVDPLAEGGEGDSPDGMQVEGTLGSLDEEAIRSGLAGSLGAIAACFRRQVAAEPYLGGELTLHFRIGRDGSTKRVRVSRSSTGSLAVERCAVASVGKVRFKRPRGGEAEFTYPLQFPAGRVDAQKWDRAMVKQEIVDHLEQLLAPPRKGDPPLQAPPGLTMTFYIDGHGKAISAGMAADEEVPAEFADALVENLKQLSFEAASGGYAKVTYSW